MLSVILYLKAETYVPPTPIASIVTTQTASGNLSHTGWVLIAAVVENQVEVVQVVVDLAVAAVVAVAQAVTGSRL
jgi:hypothetical protein